ncbi:MAG: acyl-CoA dehydrogenase family protein [Pirellulales bacterium]
MTETPRITSPDDPALDALCDELAELAGELDITGDWPRRQLELCGRYGVYEWFLPPEVGGQGWSEVDIVRGYLRLSGACLTTTFIITQRTGACRRIASSDNEPLKAKLLPELLTGESFATVGISHLTTSRRHLKRPVLRAEESDGGFVLDGYSPWVTGAAHASTVVTGATMEDQRQVLVALPTELPGVSVPEPARLVGLSASHTGAVQLDRVHVPRELLLAGPIEEVMSTGSGAGTGGLQTSTLAIGLADAAIGFLGQEAGKRDDLSAAAGRLRSDHAALESDLLAMAAGEPVCSTEDLRQRANSLALRAAQSALTAAKGSGYVLGHPAGRWCREALFFLVWSCPQPVAAANLCELAGLIE